MSGAEARKERIIMRKMVMLYIGIDSKDVVSLELFYDFFNQIRIKHSLLKEKLSTEDHDTILSRVKEHSKQNALDIITKYEESKNKYESAKDKFDKAKNQSLIEYKD